MMKKIKINTKVKKYNLKTKMPFGMFKGAKVEEIIETERGRAWLNWALNHVTDFKLTQHAIDEGCILALYHRGSRQTYPECADRRNDDAWEYMDEIF